mmetsp:Transcript_1262/g.4913  ORF Transcript_1262/g.4913 Transcript_1262/m.4913 type:complete len:207 (+) Transcript_1262:470-1090(+)
MCFLSERLYLTPRRPGDRRTPGRRRRRRRHVMRMTTRRRILPKTASCTSSRPLARRPRELQPALQTQARGRQTSSRTRPRRRSGCADLLLLLPTVAAPPPEGTTRCSPPSQHQVGNLLVAEPPRVGPRSSGRCSTAQCRSPRTTAFPWTASSRASRSEAPSRSAASSARHARRSWRGMSPRPASRGSSASRRARRRRCARRRRPSR